MLTYLTQVQSIITASLQSEIEDVLQSNSLLDCSQYRNDNHIIDSFPFIVHLNPTFQYSTMTYALMNQDDKIHYMKIINQEFVPSIIYCLKHLKRLEVQNTCFSPCNHRLPVEIESLASSLTELSIHGTKITHLPEQISKLKHLQALKLSNTGLTILPDFIGNLSSLTILYLPDNNLTSLPITINNLPLLEEITLTNNPHIHSVQPLNGHPSLIMLDTRHCPIEDLPRNLPHLTNLYMSNNSLKGLTGIETLGNGTSSQKSFYFDKNYIRSIPPQIRYVRNLYWLNLNDNQLDNLPTDIFNVTTLSRLYIQHNRFRRRDLERIVTNFHDKNPNLKLYYMTKRNPVVKAS